MASNWIRWLGSWIGSWFGVLTETEPNLAELGLYATTILSGDYISSHPSISIYASYPVLTCVSSGAELSAYCDTNISMVVT